MPQLNFETWPPQLIWLALSFLALYWLMSQVALPRIATVLENRRDRIASDLDEAARLKSETEDAIAAYDAALAEARTKAHAIAAENRNKLQAELDAERGEVESQIAARTKEAEERINAMKATAMNEINAAAADTAEAIVQTLIGAKASKAELAEAVKAARRN